MKKMFSAITVAILVLSFSSCRKLADVLPGTWNISEIKTEPASGSASTTSNAGTMTFAAGGSGTYSILVFGSPVTGGFTWVASDNGANVTLSGFNIVAGQYTVITNKNNKQVWQRLDSDQTTYTYTLER
ncbi:MAG: hypothetical protein MH137_07995 [Flavobacteriales bacterium]|nr:hypothetical protein [Flavobacteriales bacterium]